MPPIKKQKVVVILTVSPMGKMLLGLKEGNNFLFNGQTVSIIEIC